MTPDERALVLRAQQGDRGAFERLFREHHVRVYNLVYHLVRSATDADDVTQRAFVRAWEELPGLRDPRAFTAWLNRIAANLARDHARQPAGRSEAPHDDEAALERLEDGTPSPADDLLAEERDEVVHRAIATLPEHHREVVVMHHLEGREVRDIAEALGVAHGTVLSRLARARDALRRKLAPYVEA